MMLSPISASPARKTVKGPGKPTNLSPKPPAKPREDQ
jgi:hypothetical protein